MRKRSMQSKRLKKTVAANTRKRKLAINKKKGILIHERKLEVWTWKLTQGNNETLRQVKAPSVGLKPYLKNNSPS